MTILPVPLSRALPPWAGSLLLFLPALAGADAGPPPGGWEEVGPERGHILDADSGPDAVSVATRVGVLTAPVDLSRWKRDPRFPLDTRRLAVGPDGSAWAATAGRVWHAGETTTPAVDIEAGNAVVDLVVTGRGTLLAAVRGSAGRVLRVVDSGGAAQAEAPLSDLDPWCLASHGETAWVGSIEKGLWRSEDDGRTWERAVRKGSVTALGVAGDRVLAAFSDGRVLDAESEDLVVQVEGAVVIAIADDGGVPALTLAGTGARTGPLARVQDGALVPVDLGALDGGEGLVRPTGAWSLRGGGVLVGTFREGPLRLQEGRVEMARAGFRATVGSGAAVDSHGRLLLGLMGTGVYLSKDGGGTWSAQSGGTGPVTDATSVLSLGDSLAVLDFEGVALLDGTGRWTRVAGVENPSPGRRNGLEDMVAATDGGWWGLDTAGALHHRPKGASTWTRCAEPGGYHLDGGGDAIYLASAGGMLTPTDCATPSTPAWPSMDPKVTDWRQARASGPWLAMPGSLWKDGLRYASLPPARITAMAATSDRVVVAMASGDVLACADKRCDAVGSRIPGEVSAVGWLPGGPVWASERRGTLLVARGTDPVLPWSNLAGGQPPDANLQRLESPPWMMEGQPDPSRAQGGPQPGAPPAGAAGTQAPPRPTPPAHRPTWHWILGVGLALALGMGVFLVRRSRSRDTP